MQETICVEKAEKVFDTIVHKSFQRCHIFYIFYRDYFKAYRMGPALGDIFTLGCCLTLERVRNSCGALKHSWNSGNGTVAVAGGWERGHLGCVRT